MNKKLAAAVLACAGAFGVAANADARDWGRVDHGTDYTYRSRAYFEKHMDLPYSSKPVLPNYIPNPAVEIGCSNTYGGGSRRQYYDQDSHETFYHPSFVPCP